MVQFPWQLCVGGSSAVPCCDGRVYDGVSEVGLFDLKADLSQQRQVLVGVLIVLSFLDPSWLLLWIPWV